MATITLTQTVVDGLTCPQDKKKQEYVDTNRTGLYVAVSASNAIYYLRIKDKEKKTLHIRLGRTTEIRLSEARQRVKQLRAEIAAGSNIQENTKSIPTFSEFFTELYLPYIMSYKRSWAKDESLFRCHLKEELGDKRLDQISRSHAQALHMNLRDKKGLSGAQSDHAIKVLKTCMNYACNHQIISTNPISRFKLFNEPNAVNNILDEEQLKRFLNVLQTDKNRMTCLVVLWLLSTGCRLNTALSARHEHVDRYKRRWLIPSSVNKNKRQSSIVLNDSAIEVLDQLNTEGKYDYLFINFKTGNRLKSIHTGFKTLREKAGIPHFRLHDCRHQFASHCINQGRSLYEVSQLLNHSTVAISARYAHLSTKTLQEAAQCASLRLGD